MTDPKTPPKPNPFTDPKFREGSVYFDTLEFQRRFEQNLIRYNLQNAAQVEGKINNIVNNIVMTGGGGGGETSVSCYWTKEGETLLYMGGKVGVMCHPTAADFEVRSSLLVEGIGNVDPYVEIRNWSNVEHDPCLVLSLGASPVRKYTMGIDDSDADSWLLCTGDVLTSTVSGEVYGLNKVYDGTLYVTDSLNSRIKHHLASAAGTYIAKDGSLGSGDDQFNGPYNLCTDGIWLYIADGTNNRIKKHLCSDLSYVSKIGSVGSGNDQFSTPRGICTDGTYLFVADAGNSRVVKRLCADLSYVSKTDGSAGLNGQTYVATDGEYLYLPWHSGAIYHWKKLRCDNLALVRTEAQDGHNNSWTVTGVCYAAGFLYVVQDNGAVAPVLVYNAADLSYSSEFGAWGSGDGQFTHAIAIATDGTYLYIADANSGIGNPNRIMRFTMAGVYQSKYGTYGNGNDNFYSIRGICMGAYIEGETYTPFRAPLIKADLNAAWVDVFPVLRARYGLELMQYDGTSTATLYVELRSPSVITASYSIILPAGGPSSTSHFSIASGGQISWGQNVNSTASPTFSRVTCNVALGTAPFSITSGTKVATLNVDKVDGYDLDQGISSTDSPSFVKITLTQTTGTAPMTVTSTTKVSNLNVDRVDDYDFDQAVQQASSPTFAALTVLSGPAVPGRVNIETKVDVSKYAFAEVGLYVHNASATPAAKLNWCFGAEGSYDDDGTFHDRHFYIYDPERGCYNLAAFDNGDFAIGGNTSSWPIDINEFSLIVLVNGNVGFSQTTFGTNATKTLGVSTGVPPASSLADMFQMYSADQGGTAGHAAPHFRNENGNVLSLREDGYYVDGVKQGGGGGGTFITLSDCPASYATHGGEFVKVNAGENALEFVASSVAGHGLVSASHTDVTVSAPNDDDILRYDTASGKWVCEALPAAANHALLSATHSDTLADTVVRGDILVGNSTPKWARLAKGTATYALIMGADEPGWAALTVYAPTTCDYIVGTAQAGLSAEIVKAYMKDNEDPDKYPTSPNAMDDEFEDGSINAKWTIVNNPAGANAFSETAHAGMLWVGLIETTNPEYEANLIVIYQAAPGGTGDSAMTWIAKVSVANPGDAVAAFGQYAGVGILIWNTTDHEYIGLIEQLRSASSCYAQCAGIKQGAAANYALTNTTTSYPLDIPQAVWVYVKLEKSTANAWTSANTYNLYMSLNGVLWSMVGTESKTFTHAPARIGLFYRAITATTGAAKGEAVVDFFRRTV